MSARGWQEVIDRKWLPSKLAQMWRLILIFALAGCAPADQEGVRTVAAIEVVLKKPQDRIDLVVILRRHAAQAGLHVDDGSLEWRDFERRAKQIPPDDQVTFNAGVWRGEDDDEPVAFADDRFHRGRVWVTFMRGAKANRFKAYRDATISAIRNRWPEAKFLPILPWGGLPHARDLVLTSDGYRISRSSASAYELSPTLPIFADK